MKLALLDDYQQVALKSADWKRLKGVEISVFHEPFSSVDDAAKKLAPFDMLCLLRERTAFPRALVDKLPNLKFVAREVVDWGKVVQQAGAAGIE